jgi:hypothetical protein
MESTPASLPFFRLRAAEGQWQYQPFGRPELLWRSSVDEPAAGAYQGRRALVVGETTGGSSGQPYMLDLGDGMLVLVGAKRESFPDGSDADQRHERPAVV